VHDRGRSSIISFLRRRFSFQLIKNIEKGYKFHLTTIIHVQCVYYYSHEAWSTKNQLASGPNHGGHLNVMCANTVVRMGRHSEKMSYQTVYELGTKTWSAVWSMNGDRRSARMKAGLNQGQTVAELETEHTIAD
jgi:hypothetical protein